MTTNGWLQILFFLAVILAITKPLGAFMTRVFNREKTFLDFALRPIERLLYKICGVHEDREMHWTEYGTAMLLFSAVSMFLLYVIERTQHILGFNPQKLANVAPDLAWSTAASFTTNTNWQSYVPESTMSYLTQMAGLAYHNFASAAVGIALAIAVIRGIARRESKTIGNFWVDLTRSFLVDLAADQFRRRADFRFARRRAESEALRDRSTRRTANRPDANSPTAKPQRKQ